MLITSFSSDLEDVDANKIIGTGGNGSNKRNTFL